MSQHNPKHPAKHPAMPDALRTQEGAGHSGLTSGRADLLSSQRLLQGRRQLQIEHMGEIYTLRVTSKGKLILTK